MEQQQAEMREEDEWEKATEKKESADFYFPILYHIIIIKRWLNQK